MEYEYVAGRSMEIQPTEKQTQWEHPNGIR